MAPHEHGKHRNPEDLDSYIARMEDPDRAEWQKPDEVLRALRLAPGQVVCDIGAGPGYFALRMARTAAQVFAVDVEPRMLQGLIKRIVKSGLKDGEKVVSTRLQLLQPGMPVKPIPEQETSPAQPTPSKPEPRK